MSLHSGVCLFYSTARICTDRFQKRELVYAMQVAVLRQCVCARRLLTSQTSHKLSWCFETSQCNRWFVCSVIVYDSSLFNRLRRSAHTLFSFLPSRSNIFTIQNGLRVDHVFIFFVQLIAAVAFAPAGIIAIVGRAFGLDGALSTSASSAFSTLPRATERNGNRSVLRPEIGCRKRLKL